MDGKTSGLSRGAGNLESWREWWNEHEAKLETLLDDLKQEVFSLSEMVRFDQAQPGSHLVLLGVS